MSPFLIDSPVAVFLLYQFDYLGGRCSLQQDLSELTFSGQLLPKATLTQNDAEEPFRAKTKHLGKMQNLGRFEI
jgi:hypothetical protein